MRLFLKNLRKLLDTKRKRVYSLPIATAREIEMTTRHSNACTMAFGRPSKVAGTCPRCDELRAGAAPRPGYTSLRQATEQRQIAAIRAHRCAVSNCGPVCTFGDF